MYVGSSNGYAVPVYKTSDSTTRTRVHCGNCPRCNEKLVTVFVHGHERSVLNVVQLYMIAVKEKEHESGKDDVRQAQKANSHEKRWKPSG